MEIYGKPMAVIPRKEGNFDYTVLRYTNGSETRSPWHIKTVMKHLAEERGMDLALLRKGRKSVLLNLREGYVLLPVKAQAVAPTYGYVSVADILSIGSEEGQVVIRFPGGNLPVYWTLRYLADRYCTACETYGLYGRIGM